MRERIEGGASLRMVKVVLHWAWDPIGVRGVTGALDEYDNYALPVLEMLERFALEQDIADYLSFIEQEWIGLQANRDRNMDVAAMLRELHAIVA